MKEFSPLDGEFAPAQKTKELITSTHDEKVKRGQKKADYTHSQFFGKDKLEELLHNTGPECVGLRINFILEGDNRNEQGLLIQAVDKKGNVLSPVNSAMQRGDGGGSGLYGGPKCPRTCLPPLDEDID